MLFIDVSGRNDLFRGMLETRLDILAFVLPRTFRGLPRKRIFGIALKEGCE